MSISSIKQVSGTAVYVPGADIDTDRIIPARFLKCVTFDDLAEGLFYDVRFDKDGNSVGHPIDDPRFPVLPSCWPDLTSVAVHHVSTRCNQFTAAASAP
ncbi:MAG: hypothetical protein QNL01_02515 [Akkermansiaceae bacterium]|jgi:3-isopropylmalate dehydratase small subunit|tara:strand:- start:2235 stop:2531 length:297 start_codon:yes stop_codon:yes gene_type:complete